MKIRSISINSKRNLPETCLFSRLLRVQKAELFLNFTHTDSQSNGSFQFFRLPTTTYLRSCELIIIISGSRHNPEFQYLVGKAMRDSDKTFAKALIKELSSLFGLVTCPIFKVESTHYLKNSSPYSPRMWLYARFTELRLPKKRSYKFVHVEINILHIMELAVS